MVPRAPVELYGPTKVEDFIIQKVVHLCTALSGNTVIA